MNRPSSLKSLFLLILNAGSRIPPAPYAPFPNLPLLCILDCVNLQTCERACEAADFGLIVDIFPPQALSPRAWPPSSFSTSLLAKYVLT